MISDGVIIRESIKCEKKKPKTTISNVNKPPVISEVEMTFLRFSKSPFPKKFPINTDIPKQIPTIKKSIIFITGLAAPKAANALAPTNRPTITESAALYVKRKNYQ